MRFQLLSDLHFEFHRDKGAAFLDGLDPTGVDALILAGDIATHRYLEDALSEFCSLYPRVLFVPGNHEYYGSSLSVVRSMLGDLEDSLPNLVWLDNKAVDLGGVTVLGGTLWFPYDKPPHLVPMNDFRAIKGLSYWVDKEHRAFLSAFEGCPKADVVVTHHMPSDQCVSTRFRGSPVNRYFAHDMTQTIEEKGPRVWCFGHTHDRKDFAIGKTRLLSNPLAYPNEYHEEQGAYKEKLTFDVEVR